MLEYLYGLTWAANSIVHGTCLDYQFMFPRDVRVISPHLLKSWLQRHTAPLDPKASGMCTSVQKWMKASGAPKGKGAGV